jgi:HJR/Mrr/RecB family endonuclease
MTFDEWWDSEAADSQSDNPYRPDSAAYWAYAGWVAATRNSADICEDLIGTRAMARQCADEIRGSING